jgi:large-conductance mechanosensitive channel
MTLAIGTGWLVGWVVGVVVIALVAFLVISITARANRITRQAEEITKALDGGRENTLPLWEVRTTNHEIDRITRGLRRVRTGSET